MSTIAEQLQELAQIKEEIRQAIINKGVTVSSDAAFSTYATAIGQISGGGGGGDDLENLIQRAGESFTFPSGITKIGTQAFAYMSSLTSIDIPSGVTIIDGSAFQACTSLASVDLPSSLTTIGASAFSADRRIATITCRATTPPTTNANSFGNTANNYVGGLVDASLRKLYVPHGSSSLYQAATGGWAKLLGDCGFSIVELS